MSWPRSWGVRRGRICQVITMVEISDLGLGLVILMMIQLDNLFALISCLASSLRDSHWSLVYGTQRPGTDGPEVRFSPKDVGLHNSNKQCLEPKLDICGHQKTWCNDSFKKVRRFGNPGLEFLVVVGIETAQLTMVSTAPIGSPVWGWLGHATWHHLCTGTFPLVGQVSP